jgi:hypothetical protein
MPTFKKPKNVEEFIQIWGWMDDVIIKTKKKTAYNYWKKNGTPNGGNYDSIIVNRYLFKYYFSIELKNDYTRIYNVFLDTLSI